MGARADLSTFMTHLPGIDDPDERRAVVSLTRPADLGIYLDFQGSDFVFAGRLLNELSRRGKVALLEFLGTLSGALDPSIEGRQVLETLRTQVGALDDAAFRAEFPVLPPPGVPAATPKPDAAILAGALVADALVPYYALGAEPMRQKVGTQAAQAAGQIAQAVVDAFVGTDASDILDSFKGDPKNATNQSLLTRTLRRKLVAADVLAADLATLYGTASAAAEADGEQTLADVSQEAGVLRGSMLGAIVGDTVVDKLKGKINVYQRVNTLEAGASMVGVVLGGNAPVNVGGTHHHGNTIDTGGGAYIGGGVQASGDFVGRDQVVHGDQANVHQGLNGAELAAIFRAVNAQIDRRPEDPNVDKDELRDTAQKLKDEVAKGEAANATKVERWLRTLLDLAPDVAEVALAALANPVAGAVTAISRLAQRLKVARA